MSFLDKIEKAREKPETYRKKMAVVLAVLITVLIAFIWFSVSTDFFK